MPEIMNVTNAVPGYDAAAGNRSIQTTAGDASIHNVPNPSRATRPDSNAGEQQNAGSESQSGPLRYDSNFQSFLQRLQSSGDVATELVRFLSGNSRTVVSSGLHAGTADELSQVLEMLEMNEGEFLQFLKDQVASGSRFGGPLFDLLRTAYRDAGSPGLRGDILQFLKQYGDWASTSHVEGNLLRSLDQIARSMPRSWGGRVTEFLALLQNGIAAGDRTGNLKLLQREILPYLSDYVARSHDMGRARGLLTMLVLDVARYENGSQDSLLQSLHHLMNYGALKGSLGGLSSEALLSLVHHSAFGQPGHQGVFADHLSAAAGRALRGSAGAEAQEAFRALVDSILINESVYMPLNHYLLPLRWKNRTMFSELWVDPDADRDREGGSSQNRTVRLLLKADVQPFGLFDVVLTCRGKAVDLDVRCPDQIAPFSALIRNALTGILRDNGLEAGSVQVEKLEHPLTVSEVFPMIFQGRDSIDVKV